MKIEVLFTVKEILKTETQHEVAQPDGSKQWQPHFLHTVALVPAQPEPVADSPHPNRLLWKATAEAVIRLSYLNEVIGRQFVEGKTYKVAFTEA